MATREQILQGFETTIERIREQSRHFRKWDKKMQYHFPDLGEGWFIGIKEGEPDGPHEGVADGAEIVYQMDSDTFVAVVDRSISPMGAWREGKVKLTASPTDMMKLQKLS